MRYETKAVGRGMIKRKIGKHIVRRPCLIFRKVLFDYVVVLRTAGLSALIIVMRGTWKLWAFFSYFRTGIRERCYLDRYTAFCGHVFLRIDRNPKITTRLNARAKRDCHALRNYTLENVRARNHHHPRTNV